MCEFDWHLTEIFHCIVASTDETYSNENEEDNRPSIRIKSGTYKTREYANNNISESLMNLTNLNCIHRIPNI